MLNLDVVALEEARVPYDFTLKGHRLRVPHLMDLPIGFQAALDQRRVDIVLPELTLVWDDEHEEWGFWPEQVYDLAMRMHAEQIAYLQVGWLAHGGLEPGESPASSS